MPGFGPLHEAQFRHTQSLTAEGVAQRIASVSHVAVLPESERNGVLDEVRAVLAAHSALQGRTTYDLPYRVDCYCAVRS